MEIFIQDVKPFYKDNVNGIISITTREVYCASSIVISCYMSLGEQRDDSQYDVYAQNKIVIDVSANIQMTNSQNPFQIIIPISTTQNKNALILHIATCSQHIDFANKPYHLVDHLRKSTQTMAVSSQWSSLNSGLTLQSYEYLFTTSIIGTKITSIDISVIHTNATALQTGNIGSTQGSAFTIVTNQNFFKSQYSPQCTSALTGTVSNQQNCLIYEYQAGSTMKYGVFCPLENVVDTQTKITCVNLYAPIEKGQTFTGSWAGISTNTGNLVAYMQKSSNSAAFGTGVLFISPSDLTVIRQNSTKLTFSITTSTEISKYFKICISFVSAYSYLSSAEDCEITTSNEQLECNINVIPQLIELQVGTSGSTESWPATSAFDIYISNVRVDTTQSNYSSINFTASTKLSSNEIIDITDANRVLIYTLPSTVPQITIQQPKFVTEMVLAVDSFTAFFSVNREFYKTDSLTINFGQLAIVNNFGISRCKILDIYDEVSQLWSTCDCRNLTTIKIQPNQDIPPSTQFKIQFPLINVMGTMIQPGITAKMADANNLVIAEIKAPSYINYLPTKDKTDLSKFQATKTLYGRGSTPIFKFHLKTQDNSFNASQELIIRYPAFYNSKLCMPMQLACKINEHPVLCDCQEEYSIRVIGLPNIYPENDFFLTIEGVQQIYSTSLLTQYFFAGLRMIGKTEYIEQGLASDIANPQLTSNLDNLKMEMVNLNVNRHGNLTVDFKLNVGSSISATYSLVVTFPPEYGNLRGYNLSCTLTPIVSIGEPNPANIQYPECTNTAKSIIAPLTQVLDQSGSYRLQVGGVVGPEFSSCQSKKPTFGIIDETSTFVYITPENTVNMASPAYQENNDIIYIAYYQNNKQLLGNDRIITVPAGVYDNSKVVTLKPVQGLFQHFMTLKATNSTLRFLETEEGQDAGTLKIRPGDAEFNIHVTSTISSSSLTILEFEIITQNPEDISKYAPIPQLQIFVQDSVQQKVTINIQDTEIKIPINGGLSKLIRLDFSEYIPLFEHQIQYQFENTGYWLEMYNNYIVQTNVYYKQYIAEFFLTCKSDIVPNETTFVTFSLLGSHAETYTFNPEKVKIVIEEAISQNETLLEITPDDASLFSTKTFQIKSNTYGIIYWFTAFQTSPQRDSEYVLAHLSSTSQSQQNILFGEKFGYQNVDQINTSIPLTVNGLVPGLNYTSTFWFIDKNGENNQSNNQTHYFKTFENGKIQRLDFSYNQKIPDSLKSEFACNIAYYFEIEKSRIFSSDLDSCMDGIKGQHFNIDNEFKKYEALENVNNSADFTYTYFIYPPVSEIPDTTGSYLLSKINYGSEIDSVNAFFDYNNSLISVNLNSSNKQTTQPKFVKAPIYTIGDTWIQLTNLTLEEPGYIMAIVWKDTDETEVGAYVNQTEVLKEEDYTVLQEYLDAQKSMENIKNLGCESFQTQLSQAGEMNNTVVNINNSIDMAKLYFNDFIGFKEINYVWGRYLGYYYNESETLNHNFTGLRNGTNYRIYYVGINENPRFMVNRTDIYVVNIRTNHSEQYCGWTSGSLKIALIFLILTFFFIFQF